MEVDGKPGIEYGALLEDSAAVDPQSQANLEDLRAQLIDAISQLEERERLVATFYFYEGLTLKEIGKALALTEGRVSQILHRALSRCGGNSRALSSHTKSEAGKLSAEPLKVASRARSS